MAFYEPPSLLNEMGGEKEEGTEEPFSVGKDEREDTTLFSPEGVNPTEPELLEKLKSELLTQYLYVKTSNGMRKIAKII